jgi:hypothetical protein
MLVDRSAVRPPAGGTLKLALEFPARLDQPSISQGHKENWVNLSVDQVLPACNEAERSDTATQDGDRLSGVWSLSGDPAGRQE